MSTEQAPSAPSKSVLLDTSVLIPMLRGDWSLLQNVARFALAYICPPVLAELLVGLEQRGRPVAQERRLKIILQMTQLLPCDEQTARRYAELETTLRQQGTPIPPNDVWIAAVALQHNLTLATRDLHYQRIPEIDVEMW